MCNWTWDKQRICHVIHKWQVHVLCRCAIMIQDPNSNDNNHNNDDVGCDRNDKKS